MHCDSPHAPDETLFPHPMPPIRTAIWGLLCRDAFAGRVPGSFVVPEAWHGPPTAAGDSTFPQVNGSVTRLVELFRVGVKRGSYPLRVREVRASGPHGFAPAVRTCGLSGSQDEGEVPRRRVLQESATPKA